MASDFKVVGTIPGVFCECIVGANYAADLVEARRKNNNSFDVEVDPVVRDADGNPIEISSTAKSNAHDDVKGESSSYVPTVTLIKDTRSCDPQRPNHFQVKFNLSDALDADSRFRGTLLGEVKLRNTGTPDKPSCEMTITMNKLDVVPNTVFASVVPAAVINAKVWDALKPKIDAEIAYYRERATELLARFRHLVK